MADRHVILWQEFQRRAAQAETLEEEAALVALGRDLERIGKAICWTSAQTAQGLACKMRWLLDAFEHGDVERDEGRYVLLEVAHWLESKPT